MEVRKRCLTVCFGFPTSRADIYLCPVCLLSFLALLRRSTGAYVSGTQNRFRRKQVPAKIVISQKLALQPRLDVERYPLAMGPVECKQVRSFTPGIARPKSGSGLPIPVLLALGIAYLVWDPKREQQRRETLLDLCALRKTDRLSLHQNS